MKLKTEKTSSNSNQEVPKTRLALEEKYNDEKKEVLKKEEKEKTKGGILVAQETLDRLRIAVNCGYVIKLGPLAYKDEDKFPTGAWCKKGDWVIFARYAGSRLPIEGGEVRLLNDDEVLGTIKDPESVLHHI